MVSIEMKRRGVGCLILPCATARSGSPKLRFPPDAAAFPMMTFTCAITVAKSVVGEREKATVTEWRPQQRAARM